MHTTSTDCRSLDRLLDGGLESDAITLVFGEGGSGKTNLALQCARVVAASGRRVAYIDTEGVSHKRLAQVFDALPDDERAPAEERLLFFTPYTIEEQEKMVKRTSLLRDVGLIVVDSINMHYRLHIDGPGGEKEASRSLYQQLHHLTMHARQHHIPVLITGQVYGGEDATQPFARRVMEHLVKALVRFEKRPDGTRRATVLKHRSIEEGRQARFRIGGHGLEELEETRHAAAGGAADRADAAPAGSRRPGRPDAQHHGGEHGHGPDGARSHGSGHDPADRGEARREADAWGVDADESRGMGPADAAGGMDDADGAGHAGAGPDDGSGADEGGDGAWHGPDGEPRPPADGTDPDAPLDAPHPGPAGTDEAAVHADATGVSASGPRTAAEDGGATGRAPDGTRGTDDAPATSLLTEKERREAEALPGFIPATDLPPPRLPGEDADGR